MKNTYFSKSKFTLATECPTKLYYLSSPEYANKNVDNPFLLALCEGGFQVGELAKYYHPGGVNIYEGSLEEANAKTIELMAQNKVTMFEATYIYEGLLAMVDVLVKSGNVISILEVKAKTIDPDSECKFIGKRGGLLSNWKKYIYDVAFQKYILSKLYPEHVITASLYLVDKTAECPTDGLNQKFQIKKEKGKSFVEVIEPITQEDLSNELLVKCNVDDCVDIAWSETDDKGLTLIDRIHLWKDSYLNNKKIEPKLSSVCAKCEFRTDEVDENNNLKSGFKECWSDKAGFKEADFHRQSILNIWNCRKKDKFIEEGRFKLSQLDEDDFNTDAKGQVGITAGQRQWLQVEKGARNDDSLYIDYDGLSSEINSWVYPYHLIDFETSMVAVPFNKGQKPYQGIAFQFSHHVIYEDGSIEHRDEFIHAVPGVNPNVYFIRALKEALSKDNGTIFRYGAHENSYLNMIYNELHKTDISIDEFNELQGFIKEITHSKDDSVEKWKGPRDMVDMCELVKRYYYDPATKGSNSIKQVLPSVIRNSKLLKTKYSKPIYGVSNGIKSKNFKDWSWFQEVDGIIQDPYKLLPKLFEDDEFKQIERIYDDESLKDGGAAMTAYSRLQFTSMSEIERRELTSALLKYCELDTLAMVMLIEGWQDFIENPL